MSKTNNKEQIIREIQSFLEGHNNDVKFLVNVEVSRDKKEATCFFQKPNGESWTEMIPFTPFIYIKDLKKEGYQLYSGDRKFQKSMMDRYGITITPMKTGKQPRLENGYKYKVTSSGTINDIFEFFQQGGMYPYEKKFGADGKPIQDKKSGRFAYRFAHLFNIPKPDEQFFISTGIRLFKGIEEYKDVHRVTFDIETTGLRYEISRVFAIGVRDNRGFEIVLEADKLNDDESERRLIQDFFNTIKLIEPAIITGYNSENFDFEYLFGRAGAKFLNIDWKKIPTTRDPNRKFSRNNKASLKVGNTKEDYTSTIMWGYNVIDTIHAAKRTAAVNTDLKNTKLKYVAKFEDIAKDNRMYIEGEFIGKMWSEDKQHIINPSNNNYIQIPDEFQEIGGRLLKLQEKKSELSESDFKQIKSVFLKEDPKFVNWFRIKATQLFIDDESEKPQINFIQGKDILRRYLLDDLWETEQVDNLYNQSSFLLAKLVPTNFARVSTMGNAAVWNLLMTAWSYENDLAIPQPDVSEKFSGGLARCYKKGWTSRLVKIDFASLYPMEQLTWGIFPMFDITGAIEKILIYMTTTRNIYKKLANSDDLLEEEISLMKSIDHETYEKYINNSFTPEERKMYKTKQLPIKILNNSLFGALGSAFAFNWSDNTCAARITCTGRIDLRHAITWFKVYGLEPLLAVTDGVNFGIPNHTCIMVTNEGVEKVRGMVKIEEAWKYNGKVGVAALIEKFNHEEMTSPFMSVDNDGEFLACLNLSRINYALLVESKDKKTGKMKKKIKLTGNTIKSKTMSEYIEDFIGKGFELILDGKGAEFVEYYHSYAEDIFYKQIPLKKIASKNKMKRTINQYLNRGKDKTGKKKASQEHMELIVADRLRIANGIFEEKFEELLNTEKIKKKDIEKYTDEEVLSIVDVWMPPAPELDSMIYHINTGERKSHGDVKKDPLTGEMIFKAKLINANDLEENPDLKGEYNVEKYLAAFNKRVKVLLDGFDTELTKIPTKKTENNKHILVRIVEEKKKDASGKVITTRVLKKDIFTKEELQLRNIDLDDFDESMFLERKEIIFWNRYGYDPYKIWDGFNTKEGDKHGLLELDIYENALKFLSDQMEKSGKPRLKSVNDEYKAGDYVLIKTADIDKTYREILEHKFSVAYYNGVHLEILRENVPVPKSEREIAMEDKLEKLRVQDSELLDDKQKEYLNKKEERKQLFVSFKKKWGIPEDYTEERMYEEAPKSKLAFDDYLNDYQQDHDDIHADYLTIDDGDF